jgi:hypothetical protein
MDDLELRAELSKELRAVEARIARSARGGNGHGEVTIAGPNGPIVCVEDPLLASGEVLGVETEIAEAEHEAQRWPEVEP